MKLSVRKATPKNPLKRVKFDKHQPSGVNLCAQFLSRKLQLSLRNQSGILQAHHLVDRSLDLSVQPFAKQAACFFMKKCSGTISSRANTLPDLSLSAAGAMLNRSRVDRVHHRSQSGLHL